MSDGVIVGYSASTTSNIATKTITINSRELLCKVLIGKAKLQFNHIKRYSDFVNINEKLFVTTRSYEYVQSNKNYNTATTKILDFAHNNQLRKKR